MKKRPFYGKRETLQIKNMGDLPCEVITPFNIQITHTGINEWIAEHYDSHTGASGDTEEDAVANLLELLYEKHHRYGYLHCQNKLGRGPIKDWESLIKTFKIVEPTVKREIRLTVSEDESLRRLAREDDGISVDDLIKETINQIIYKHALKADPEYNARENEKKKLEFLRSKTEADLMQLGQIGWPANVEALEFDPWGDFTGGRPKVTGILHVVDDKFIWGYLDDYGNVQVDGKPFPLKMKTYL